jgi:hypothetical protein
MAPWERFMQIFVHAKSSGKTIQVKDRIAGREPFNDFVDGGASVPVTVASNDGQTGDIDINARMRGDSPWYIVKEDYAVRAGETVDVDDV